MSAEHGGHGQSRGITPAEAIGVTAEVGVITLGAYEIITAGLLWPIAVGGAIFLLGRGLVRSARREKAKKSSRKH